MFFICFVKMKERKNGLFCLIMCYVIWFLNMYWCKIGFFIVGIKLLNNFYIFLKCLFIVLVLIIILGKKINFLIKWCRM